MGATPRDMLYRDVGFPHRIELPVLGVATCFEASEPALLEQVVEAFGPWRGLEEHVGPLADARVVVRLAFHEDDPSDADNADVRYRKAGADRLVVATPGSLAFADLATGEAYAWITPTLVSRGAHFRFAVLSALTLYLVTAHDRRPVHAGAVAGRTGALLLHGPSGVGKSTLTLACALRGLTVLAEDCVYVQVGPPFRVWGMPGPTHLPEESLRFFPEMTEVRPVVRGNGTTKVAVPLPVQVPGLPPVRERAGICLLRPSRGSPRVERASPAAVERAVGQPDEPGFDVFRDAMDGVPERLSEVGAWTLHLGCDPHAAADLVAGLLDRIERGA